MSIVRLSDSSLEPDNKVRSVQGINGWADFSNTPTGQYTSGGILYKYVTFAGSGTLNVTKSGIADVLLIGGGGSGGSYSPSAGGGGAGGFNDMPNTPLTKGSYAVVVGGGAGWYGKGGETSLGPWKSTGGGHGNFYNNGSGSGSSGGGGSAVNAWPGSVGQGGGTFMGNNGGNNGSHGGGAGGTPTGKANNWAGTSPTGSYTAGNYTFSRGGDPGNGGGANAAANTGNGGTGSSGDGGTGNGGSGIVIVRVRVA